MIKLDLRISRDSDMSYHYLNDFYAEYNVFKNEYNLLVVSDDKLEEYSEEIEAVKNGENLKDELIDYFARGYSQGFFLNCAFIGIEPIDKEFIEDLFFYDPIYGTLTISEYCGNGKIYDEKDFKELEIIHLNEFMNDNYKYDKKEIILNYWKNGAKVSHGIQKGEILDYLRNHLPDYV